MYPNEIVTVKRIQQSAESIAKIRKISHSF
jgi:hypothetical protein